MASNGKITEESRTEKGLDGMGRGSPDVLFHYLCGGTRNNHENINAG
jgi:hypothetical protein